MILKKKKLFWPATSKFYLTIIISLHRQSSTKVQMVQRWGAPQQWAHFRALLPYTEYATRRCRGVSLRRDERRGIHIQRSSRLRRSLWVSRRIVQILSGCRILRIDDFNLSLDMGMFDDLTEKVMTVESGSAAILELPPIESHPTPEVTWFSSDGTLLYGIKYATTHHTLLILNASESDEGSYRFV